MIRISCVLTCSIVFFSIVAQGQSLPNSIEAGWRFDDFLDGLSDRNIAYLQYGRKFNNHELLFRVNSVWRFGTTGVQGEIDFYPKFSEKAYGYFNIGYSGSPLFPQWRAGAEYFTGFARKWEASLGIRTIFPQGTSIIAPTGTIGVYLGRWYTYLRPTLNILPDGVSLSVLWDTRYYWTDFSFLQLYLFRGTDNGTIRDFNAIENTLGLDTYLIRTAVNFNLQQKTILKIGTDYSWLFIPERDSFIRDWGFDITLRRNF